MSKIRVMSESMSNKIAAGEVIERPASVVKELVENAIDAGATAIKIEIERAGSRLILVSDNGSGMDGDDVLLALEPHGTSKIFTDEDITNIRTLGFRGEALPSIASISKFQLRSRTAGALEGTILTVHGGKFIEASPAGCPQGTQIRVSELFFNTPARKKFLKSPSTEEHHIEEMVLMLALPHPQVAFTLSFDGRLAFHSPASEGLDARLRAFFGKEFAAGMIALNHQENGLVIHGFTGRPGFTRSSRKEQRTFVNGRAVESQALYRGLRDGYATLAERGRYAPCILFVELPVEEVDVNVHPAKREVRFRHEFAISDAVCNAVTAALKNCRTETKNVFAELSGKVSLNSIFEDAERTYQVAAPEPELNFSSETPIPYLPEKPLSDHSGSLLTDRREMTGMDLLQEEKELQEKENSPAHDPMAPAIILTTFEVEYPDEVLGILDNSYILCQGREGLILIDQHAAHERVLFEKLLIDAGKEAPIQSLLLPQVLDLPRNSASLLLRNRKTFEKLGFDIEPLGSNSVMLNGIPLSLPGDNVTSLLQDMLAELLDSGNTRSLVEMEHIARSACKAAVKIHDHITLDGAKLLLTQLRNCRQGTLCPHGRPTMLTISRKEINRRFGR